MKKGMTPAQAIVATNLVTLVAALIQGWGMIQLLVPFWGQSVIIGLYALLRIRKAAGWDLRYPLFFLAHYGGFHAVYLILLIALTGSADAEGMVPVHNTNTGETMQLYAGTYTPVDGVIYLGLIIGFWLTHRASHRRYLELDLASRPSAQKLMSVPYLRILPMHLTLILGVALGGPGTVIFFLILKTAADLLMHRVEHRMLSQKQN
jgi:hypothetical protein